MKKARADLMEALLEDQRALRWLAVRYRISTIFAEAEPKLFGSTSIQVYKSFSDLGLTGAIERVSRRISEILDRFRLEMPERKLSSPRVEGERIIHECVAYGEIVQGGKRSFVERKGGEEISQQKKGPEGQIP